MNPIPVRLQPLNAIPSILSKAERIHVFAAAPGAWKSASTGISSAMRGTSGATVPRVPQTAAYSRLALATGQDRLWMARVIVNAIPDHLL